MAPSRRHRSLTYAVLLGLVLSLLVWVQPSVAVMAPSTLAERKPVQAGPVEVDFPIGYLGVLWDAPGAQDHAAERGEAGEHGAVRFRHDGAWGPWVPLIEDGAQAEGQWSSGLVHGGGAQAYQVSGVPAEAVAARAVAINTTDGPLEKVGELAGGAASAAGCLTRAQWGADESLRLDAAGGEVWPPVFYPVQALTVHHTATRNADPDPAATVRAIYRYHAVDNGWGDIGYQYLVDEAGRVYEGRWSGEASATCADIAHQSAGDDAVVGAHTGGWNSGNVGVALLGEFTTHRRTGGSPAPAAMAALEDVLVDLTVRHGLDAQAEITYVNPVSAETKVVDAIGGHRDYLATECPGERLYALLPQLRDAVAARAGPGGEPPEEPVVGTMHVGDLDGAAVVRRNQWEGQVKVTVVDGAATPSPVDGALVTGTWDTGAQATCTTSADGVCTVTEVARKGVEALTFSVDGVTRSGYTYDASANTDPDGDSDGTTITVVRSG